MKLQLIVIRADFVDGYSLMVKFVRLCGYIPAPGTVPFTRLISFLLESGLRLTSFGHNRVYVRLFPLALDRIT